MGKDLRSLGLPRRPNPLRGKDLGQQQHKLDFKIKVELGLGYALDIARLAGMEDFAPFHDFRPLVAVTVRCVEDNTNDASRFCIQFLHSKFSKVVVG